LSERGEALACCARRSGEQPCWIVGGAVRDRLRGVADIEDFDLVLAGDVARRGTPAGPHRRCGSAFALSEEFGAWRVVARSGSWQADSTRCAAIASRPISRCATSPSTRSPSRSAADHSSIRSAARATSSLVGCGSPRRTR
jgi:hypothetical protein